MELFITDPFLLAQRLEAMQRRIEQLEAKVQAMQDAHQLTRMG